MFGEFKGLCRACIPGVDNIILIHCNPGRQEGVLLLCVQLTILPVCVSHPGQSEKAAHSAALKVTGAVLVHNCAQT